MGEIKKILIYGIHYFRSMTRKHGTCITDKEYTDVPSLASTSTLITRAFVYNIPPLPGPHVIVCASPKGSDTSNSNMTRVEGCIVEIYLG